MAYQKISNCLKFVFEQTLKRSLENIPLRKFNLDFHKKIEIAFEERAQEMGIKAHQITNDEVTNVLEKGGFVALVYGYYLKGTKVSTYTEYEYSDFHVVLMRREGLFHKNGLFMEPSITSFEELEEIGYKKPVFFEIEKIQD